MFKRHKEDRYLYKVGEACHLADLAVGQAAKVIALHNDNEAVKRRLLDMGITRGVIIKIKKISPLGDPINISLRGYELCIRLNDMKTIDVEVIDENSIGG